MTDRARSNQSRPFGLPADFPVDLDTLGALVEGDLEAREAEAVRERVLRADPDLARRIEMMAEDRVMLRLLPDEPAPEGLGEAVVARVEREALLGLSGGDGDGPIPISRYETQREGRRWLTTPAGAGLAAAALLALVVGVMMQTLPWNGGGPAPAGPRADALAGGDPVRDVQPLAMAPLEAARAVAADAPAAADVAELRAEPGAEGLTLAALEESERTFTDDWDRALALLREGRLLVRVRSASPPETLARLEPLHARSSRAGEAWRLEETVSQTVASAMHARYAPASQGASLMLADGAAAARAEPLADPVSQRSALEAIFLADARCDRSAMASLLAALSLGDGQVAVFEELAEPLELPGVYTPDAVLWWSRPVQDWAERRHVPVVLERVER